MICAKKRKKGRKGDDAYRTHSPPLIDIVLKVQGAVVGEDDVFQSGQEPVEVEPVDGEGGRYLLGSDCHFLGKE